MAAGSGIEFFATEDDLQERLSHPDLKENYQFITSLSRLNEESIILNSPKDLITYLPKYTGRDFAVIFLVLNKLDKINIQAIKMIDGSGVKYSASQGFNVNGIEIVLGGDVSNKILMSQIRTTGETTIAKENFKLFKKIFIKNARLTKENRYVMPDALAQLGNGARLVERLNNDPKWDVKLDDLKPAKQ